MTKTDGSPGIQGHPGGLHKINAETDPGGVVAHTFNLSTRESRPLIPVLDRNIKCEETEAQGLVCSYQAIAELRTL